MTPLPPATRQTYRQLNFPPFENSIAKEIKNSGQELTLRFQGAVFPTRNTIFLTEAADNPPLEYGYELITLYHPMLLLLYAEQETAAFDHATTFQVLARMILKRRGHLLWEGSPSLAVIHSASKESRGATVFAGGWGVSFQNPLLIQSPGELEVSVYANVAVENLQVAAIKYGYEIYGEESHGVGEEVPEEYKGYIGAGSIGYSMVKL